MDALRSWLSEHSTTEMQGGEVYITIDSIDDDEMAELRRLLVNNNERLGKRFLDALSRVGIEGCYECRSIINDSKCRCASESVA